MGEETKIKKPLKRKSKLKILTPILLILIIIVIIYCSCKSILDKKENEKIYKVQNSTEEFIEQVRNTGKLTDTIYNELIDELNSTGYVYNLELSVQVYGANSLKYDERKC